MYVENFDSELFLKSFGLNLSRIRKEKGFSQEKLANEADIDISTLSRIERGILNISIVNTYKISISLGITHQELFNFKLKD